MPRHKKLSGKSDLIGNGYMYSFPRAMTSSLAGHISTLRAFIFSPCVRSAILQGTLRAKTCMQAYSLPSLIVFSILIVI